MEIVLLIAVVAAVAWWAAYARHGSLLLGCGAFVALGYILGPPLWSSHAGPVPLTVDRVLLVALGAAFVWQWRQGRLRATAITAMDWIVLAAIGYFTLRCAMTPAAPFHASAVKPWWRLIAAFWVPAALYVVARTAPLDERTWRQLLWALAGLGGYLAVTAFAEVTHQWWAVFPRYIADPTLGTHFGRARGPALNSASLGVMLTVCFWAAWMLLPKLARPGQLAIAGLLAGMAAAVFFTYTRSTWIGLAGGLAVIPLVQLPREWRGFLAIGAVMLGAVGMIAFGEKVTDLGRKDTDGSAEHSVYQRASFVYVSTRMFKDAPLLGHGFSRFYDLKMPYLADRSQSLELESLRKLDHHNTFLSVLVETGLVGFLLFIGLLIAWAVAAWRLMRDASREPWQRAHGLFALAVLIAYSASALFHDLTLSASEQWLPFLTGGLSVALLASRATARQPQRRRAEVQSSNPLSVGMHHHQTLAPANTAMNQAGAVSLFGMKIDALDMRQTVDALLGWCREPRGPSCRYVVTPNVDHAVMYQTNDRLRQSYAGASLILADGFPVVLASRLLGCPLPERVAGSDLAPAMFKYAAGGGTPLRVFLLGAAPGVGQRAAENISNRWSNIEIAGVYSPPLGFELDKLENDRILEIVAAARPDLLILGLGAPKQELWVHANADRLQAKVALCIGATIDFLAGEKRRAPRWMRRLGLEWFHRLASEPGRLFRRYARDAWIFPQLVWRDWRRKTISPVH